MYCWCLLNFDNNFLNVQAICCRIRAMAKPMFSEYIGKFQIQSIEFESLSLGTLPPKLYG